MTGLVRKATLIGVCGLLAATTAFANAPSPGNSDLPAWISLVGSSAGIPTPNHPGLGGNDPNVTVVVRDFTNNPLAGQTVEFDFSTCLDARVCDAVVAGAGTPSCAVSHGKVTATTNAAGTVSLTIIGGANNTGPVGGVSAAGESGPCVTVRAGSTVLGTVSFDAYDQNLAGGFTGGDASLVNGDVLLAANYRTRSDHNRSGTLTGSDFSIEQGVVLLQGGATPGFGPCPGSYCP